MPWELCLLYHGWRLQRVTDKTPSRRRREKMGHPDFCSEMGNLGEMIAELVEGH